MSKKVTLMREPLKDFIVATFYVDDREVHKKILDEIEIFGLNRAINIETLPLEMMASKLIKKIDQTPFLTKNGEPTGFELLLVDLIYKQ